MDSEAAIKFSWLFSLITLWKLLSYSVSAFPLASKYLACIVDAQLYTEWISE